MGVCGCGELSPEKVYRVGDQFLVVELYRGCSDCGTGLMVSLHLMTPEAAKQYDIEPNDAFPPDKYGWSQVNIPIVGREDLVEAAEVIEENGSLTVEYDSLADLLRDEGLDLLQRGVRIREAATSK